MDTTGMFSRMLAVLACAALVLTSFGASAQSEPADDEILVAQAEATEEEEAREAPQDIEEITVTSRRRVERLQEVPIAITTFSEVDLQDRSIRRLEDIMHNVPNFMMDSAVFAGGDSARTYMRGVGNGNASSRDNNGTGIYIDGVFIPRAVGQLLAVSDIERIEVLRGPQGTLFGKNTIGGAVSIHTAKPAFDFGGYGEVRLGNFQQADTRFSVNIPLTETLASRFSFATRTSEGYMENKLSHNDFNDDRLLGGRASFLWDATDNVEVLWTIDGAKERKAPAANKCSLQANHLEGVREVV